MILSKEINFVYATVFF